jgi:hypothetical protein
METEFKRFPSEVLTVEHGAAPNDPISFFFFVVQTEISGLDLLWPMSTSVNQRTFSK